MLLHAIPRDASDACQARRTLATCIVHIAHIVALPIGANTEAAPTTDTVHLLIHIHVRPCDATGSWSCGSGGACSGSGCWACKWAWRGTWHNWGCRKYRCARRIWREGEATRLCKACARGRAQLDDWTGATKAFVGCVLHANSVSEPYSLIISSECETCIDSADGMHESSIAIEAPFIISVDIPHVVALIEKIFTTAHMFVNAFIRAASNLRTLDIFTPWLTRGQALSIWLAHCYPNFFKGTWDVPFPPKRHVRHATILAWVAIVHRRLFKLAHFSGTELLETILELFPSTVSTIGATVEWIACTLQCHGKTDAADVGKVGRDGAIPIFRVLEET
mmetsp:Transcript_20351/g.43424  ORF Transcript_20351/g.43424 Transcript_20351/m.43424 type:complete len:335 (+) Transcript_20351:229-1233(+)